jgi:hypothetical protein
LIIDSGVNIVENKNGELLPDCVHDEDGHQQLLWIIPCPVNIIAAAAGGVQT